MDKDTVLDRLRELGIYSEYYYRLEIKPLGAVLSPRETLNCVATGVVNGRRQMIAVTSARVIIIGAALATATDVISIKRNAITEWKFNKKFLLSSIELKTKKESYLIKQTQGGRCELFNWAMEQPVKE